MQPILRHLDNYRVFNASLRINPEIRSNLPASGQSQQYVVDNILFAERQFLSFEPIYVELNLRRVHYLLHKNIDRARNILDLLLKLCRDLMSSFGILSADLNIDGRWHSEVERLIGDIGRLEKESILGKLLWEFCPQDLHPLLRGPMFFGECNHNGAVAIACSVIG